MRGESVLPDLPKYLANTTLSVSFSVFGHDANAGAFRDQLRIAVEDVKALLGSDRT